MWAARCNVSILNWLIVRFGGTTTDFETRPRYKNTTHFFFVCFWCGIREVFVEEFFFLLLLLEEKAAAGGMSHTRPCG
jgi:hypothetical protein